MDKNMMHLAKITIANLTAGSLNPTEAEVISAMLKAVAKEEEMGRQLLASPAKRDAFAKVMIPLFYEAVHA